MTTEGQLEPTQISRRSMVRGMGVAGASAFLGGSLVRSAFQGGPAEVAVRFTPASRTGATRAASLAPSAQPLGVWDPPSYLWAPLSASTPSCSTPGRCS
jgi:hypothetical protein